MDSAHMKTKSIRQGRDPWIFTAQLGQKTLRHSFQFPKKNKLSGVEVITRQTYSAQVI